MLVVGWVWVCVGFGCVVLGVVVVFVGGEVEDFHPDGRNHEGNDKQQPDVLVDIVAPLTRQIRTLAKTLHEDEVGEGSEGDSTKDSDGIAGMLSVVEREDDTGNPHHERTENKGDDDR